MAGVFAGVGSVFVCVHTLCMVGPYCVHFEVLVMCDFHTDFLRSHCVYASIFSCVWAFHKDLLMMNFCVLILHLSTPHLPEKDKHVAVNVKFWMHSHNKVCMQSMELTDVWRYL